MNLSRRRLLSLTGAAAAAGLLGACSTAKSSSSSGNKAAVDAQIYTGGTFDAKGETLRIAIWGGSYGDYTRKFAINQFEKDFNCKVSIDTSFPWFPKFAANGIDNPPFDLSNWNPWELAKTAVAGDYFVSVDTLKKNLPEAQNMWPFAFANGHGVTYMYTQYGYAYRKDLVPEPKSFKDFWNSAYSGKRATYTSSNGLEIDFLLASCAVFGSGLTNLNAGYEAMRKGMPMKIIDFTGNMQTQLASGEVQFAVLDDGEAYQSIDNGVPLGFMYWTEQKPILSQTLAVSKHTSEIRQRLAYALTNRICSADFLEKFGQVQYQRPANKLAKIPAALQKFGAKNTEDQTAGFMAPDWNWFATVAPDVSRTLDGIFNR